MDRRDDRRPRTWPWANTVIHMPPRRHLPPCASRSWAAIREGSSQQGWSYRGEQVNSCYQLCDCPNMKQLRFHARGSKEIGSTLHSRSFNLRQCATSGVMPGSRELRDAGPARRSIDLCLMPVDEVKLKSKLEGKGHELMVFQFQINIISANAMTTSSDLGLRYRLRPSTRRSGVQSMSPGSRAT